VHQQGLSQVYRGRGRRTLGDVFDADHADHRQAGRFRWLLSTCLAAMVGAVAIGIVIFGSLGTMETEDGVPSVLKRIRDSQLPGRISGMRSEPSSLRWLVPRADQLAKTQAVQPGKHIIHEQIQVRRDGRPFIQVRPYTRVVALLQPVPKANADVIPAFNPLALYAEAPGESRDDGETVQSPDNVRVDVVELLGGSLPVDDGLEIDAQEVTDLVAQMEAEEARNAKIRPGFQPESLDIAAGAFGAGGEPTELTPQRTTIVAKSKGGADETVEDLEGQVVKPPVQVARGDTLQKILMRMGGDDVQVRAMLEAARPIFSESALVPGMQVHVTLVPTLAKPDVLEPAKFTVYGDGHVHRVTVMRNAAGDFVASAKPVEAAIPRAAMTGGDTAQSASLYASLYNAALSMGVPSDVIMQILRLHAYSADYRVRVLPGDSMETFFDTREDGTGGNGLGELLFSGLTTGGEHHQFWRFRTPDGVVDYYDEEGNNSRKFLIRRPVRGDMVRLASGFGMRRHPLLNVVRPHNGIDWAGPVGTPILAAGNGVIEEAGRKGDFGNYIRIQHANGYHTAYAHLSQYAPRTVAGARVRQGEVIGYIGQTGLAEGPHLHFEVLVNNRHVDPLTIQVPTERRLAGRQLADFQRERGRIDELRRQRPVQTETR
jgi:murein DD-endopeptidase MepM/ murein hydrolase activator NlpD